MMDIGYHICHNCGNKMYRQITNETYVYNGKSIKVSNVQSFKCSYCDEVILEHAEVKRIEQVILNSTE